MPAATRQGDLSAGHCFNPRPNNSGSDDVFINGKPAHRQGDGWPSHTCGKSSHASVTSGGSSTVFVNGKPAARIGDALNCGDTVAQGSEDVMMG
jgi:uncharacterized Zn-binding protein involved in type VI secretion